MSMKYFAIAGILAPLLYFSMVIILGLLDPNYSHMTKMMSILGGVGGIRGLVFNLGVSLVGVLSILFAVGLHKSINQGKGSKIGPILLSIGGIGLIGSGIFHCNLNCANVIVEKNLIGSLHMLSAFIAGMCLSISPFFIFARLKHDPRWKKYRPFTLIVAILANIPGIFLWITLATIRFPEIEGLIQRLGLVFTLVWIAIMSLKMLKFSINGNLKTIGQNV
jgi:hypothetical membrane protein